MKHIIHALAIMALLAGISMPAQAQKKLYLCSDYTYAGDPMGAANTWNIPKAGGAVYMVYKNDGQKITSPRLYLFIDKMVGTEYKQYDSKTIICNKYLEWALYDYTFTEAGSYKITVRSDLGVDQASEFCTVLVEGHEEIPTDAPGGTHTTTTPTPTTDVVSSDYYIDAKVQFCEEVDGSGSPVKLSDLFNIDSRGGYLYILVSSTKPLKTSQLIIDIWTGEEYKEPVETIYADVDPSKTWVKTKYILKNKGGSYKFSVFNKDQTFVQSGYLTVNVQ